MPAKVLITIDTEPDNQWDADLRRNPRFENISELPKLQKIFSKFGARPSYLATFSVVKCAWVSVLKDIARSKACEIGSHLHAWDTPPFIPPVKGNGTYLHQYPDPVQKEKLLNLDRAVTEAFGQKPVSYRGGRYSFSGNIVSLLGECGYLVDTTVTPGISWENDGGTDFKKIRCREYYLSDGKSGVLEVPVSIRIRTKLASAFGPLYLNAPGWTHAEGILRRIAGFNLIWLDPSFNSLKDMRWAADMFLGEGARYLNIVFHSSSVIPGGSPYTKDKKSTDDFFARLEGLLEYLLINKRLESATLGEFYRYCGGS